LSCCVERSKPKYNGPDWSAISNLVVEQDDGCLRINHTERKNKYGGRRGSFVSTSHECCWRGMKITMPLLPVEAALIGAHALQNAPKINPFSLNVPTSDLGARS
jgi:hypothetical protein